MISLLLLCCLLWAGERSLKHFKHFSWLVPYKEVATGGESCQVSSIMGAASESKTRLDFSQRRKRLLCFPCAKVQLAYAVVVKEIELKGRAGL